MELPAINPAGDVPSILVVNVQVSIFFIPYPRLVFWSKTSSMLESISLEIYQVPDSY